MKINSKEYWEERYKTDWLEYQGDKQTSFFAKILCDLVPDFLTEDIKKHKYKICNLGCAMGQAEPIFKEKFETEIEGMDFSPVVIDIARSNNPGINYWVGDLNSLKSVEKYDVTIISNVLEHFHEPWKIVENILNITTHYFIMLVPFEEKLEIDEHAYKFYNSVIPEKICDYILIYSSVIDGSKIENSQYPDQQILLVYENRNDINVKGNMQKIVDLQEELKRTFAYLETLERKLNNSLALNELYEKNIKDAVTYCYHLNDKRLMRWFEVLTRFGAQFVHGDDESRKLFVSVLSNYLIHSQPGLRANDGYNPVMNIVNNLTNPYLYKDVEPKDKVMNLTFERGGKIHTKKISNTVTKEALLNGNKNYDVIVLSVIDYDFRYQRPQQIADKYAKNGHRVFYVNANFGQNYEVEKEKDNIWIIKWPGKCSAVYYIYNWSDYGTWFMENMEKLINDYAITDAVILLDYPTWINGAIEIREKYGYKIIVDYMDDHTGFEDTSSKELMDNSIKMLQTADAVIVSSIMLEDNAKKYSKNTFLIRNGADFEHFYKAIDIGEEPNHRIIGYYGAISHWFDYKKIIFLADQIQDAEIILIGAVTSYEKELSKKSNIKMLGEIPYKKLPEYLKTFDVCLIPFDTSTDLIKATNPVKFYEYLSAGKKIVTTEIPELEPYKDKYLYMANDDKEFVEYVRICLEGKDTLADVNECLKFAQKNSWDSRYASYDLVCKKAYPKVSIIVLTYNNLELNKKCINSILNETGYPNFELIIVDNLSNDGTVEYLHALEEKGIENVHVIFNNNNLGFAAGNNVGMRNATGKYVVLLNNDTIVTRGWLTGLVKHMEEDSKLGMCGSVTNSIGNEAMIPVDYHNVQELREFSFAYLFDNMGKLYEHPVNRLAFFSVIIRKEIIDKCGYLDENYGIGMFEDDDYAMVVKNAGYNIAIAEDSFVHHAHSASFKKLDDDKYKALFEMNKSYFEKKWNTRWSYAHYRSGVSGYTNKGMMIDLIDSITGDN